MLILGQKEEKFFSKAITHVITNRSIPSARDHAMFPDIESAPHTDVEGPSNAQQPTTINPLLLERSSEATQAQLALQMPRGRTSIESRRQQTLNADVLLKAKEMGGKITLTDETGGVAHVTIADVKQSNGVIHVIDTVMMP